MVGDAGDGGGVGHESSLSDALLFPRVKAMVSVRGDAGDGGGVGHESSLSDALLFPRVKAMGTVRGDAGDGGGVGHASHDARETGLSRNDSAVLWLPADGGDDGMIIRWVAGKNSSAIETCGGASNNTNPGRLQG